MSRPDSSHQSAPHRPDDDAPTSSQLRHAIDAGAGGDKVAFGDPAAAPLGADDEAAGFPPTAEQRRAAFAHEVTERPRDVDAHSAAKASTGVAARPRAPRPHAPRAPWIVSVFGVAVVIGVWAAMAWLGGA